jgi:hypothetical protein
MTETSKPQNMPAAWEAVYDRVKWWMNDMAFKPPELLSGRHGEHYFECMAQDIASHALDEDHERIDGTLSAASRLDP